MIQRDIPYCIKAKHSPSHYSVQDCMIFERDAALARAETLEKALKQVTSYGHDIHNTWNRGSGRGQITWEDCEYTSCSIGNAALTNPDPLLSKGVDY